MLQFSVDSSICTRCGLCASDCVAQIIDQIGDNPPSVSAENQGKCFECQHCLAVCPTGALSVCGKSPADSRTVIYDDLPKFDAMDQFIRARRSFRKYHDENVDPALIKSMLYTLAYAPTGANAQELIFTVIDDKDDMHRFQQKMVDILMKENAQGNISQEYARLHQILSLPRDAMVETIFRGAPHMLLVSAPPDAPCAVQDIALSIAYFEMLAQSAGLGTVWWGYLRAAITAVPELRSLLDLPEDYHYYAILFGNPAIKYARTVQRDDLAVMKRLTF